MLSAWEKQYRSHWPHHYRDILDKLESSLPFVLVTDTLTDLYLAQNCPKPMVRLEKTFKKPFQFKIIVENPLDRMELDRFIFGEGEQMEAILKFIQIIGGWEEQS